MALMTDGSISGSVSQFYDRLADGYDRMTGFEERFARERPCFESIVERFSIRTAVDAGAGTGFHSLLLAGLGVRVTAVDSSHRMLSLLSAHASTMQLQVDTVACDLVALHEHIPGPVDGVFALGNTLAHCLSQETLQEVLRSFRRILRPGGIVVAQILNYRRILSSRETIIARKEVDGYRYTRSYEYVEKLVRFTITREDLAGRVAPEVTSIDLFPFLETDLGRALSYAGFEDVQMFGGISMEAYHPSRSKDLVFMARRPNESEERKS